MQDTINSDLKAAMLAGERDKVEVLRMLKSALQMAAIEARGNLSEDAALKVLAKEAKRRRDAAGMYLQGGNQDRADQELAEAAFIDTYLPAQMPEAEIIAIIEEVMADQPNANMGQLMGQLMGQVMQKIAGQADGQTVSKLLKEKLG